MGLAVVAEAPAPRRLLESVSECGVESVEVGWKHDGVGGKRRGNGELTFLPVNVAEVTTRIDNISYSALELFCFWVQRLVYTLSIRRFRWVGTGGVWTRFERDGNTQRNKMGSYLGNHLPLSYPITGALPRLLHPPQSDQAAHHKDEP